MDRSGAGLNARRQGWDKPIDEARSLDEAMGQGVTHEFRVMP